MADTLDLGSSAERCAGSSPVSGTTDRLLNRLKSFVTFSLARAFLGFEPIKKSIVGAFPLGKFNFYNYRLFRNLFVGAFIVLNQNIVFR